MLKKQIFEQKSSCDIFKTMLDMNVRFFGGRKTSHELTLKRLPDPQPTQRRPPPTPLVNSCLFWRFLGYFYLQLELGKKLVNICWPNFWRVQLIPKSTCISNIIIIRQLEVLIFTFKVLVTKVPFINKYVHFLAFFFYNLQQFIF